MQNLPTKQQISEVNYILNEITNYQRFMEESLKDFEREEDFWNRLREAYSKYVQDLKDRIEVAGCQEIEVKPNSSHK